MSAGYVATEGYPNQASTFTRGYVSGRSPGENVTDRNLTNSGVVMRAQTLGGKRGSIKGNEVISNFSGLLAILSVTNKDEILPFLDFFSN